MISGTAEVLGEHNTCSNSNQAEEEDKDGDREEIKSDKWEPSDVPTTTWHSWVESSEVKWNEKEIKIKNVRQSLFIIECSTKQSKWVGKVSIEQWVERSRTELEELPFVSVTFRQIESENLRTK